MPCLLAALVLLFPRIAILILYFFTNFFTGLFSGSVLIPFLGFLFMPVTLVAYSWLTQRGQPADALYLVVMIVAVAIDFGLLEGGRRTRR